MKSIKKIIALITSSTFLTQLAIIQPPVSADTDAYCRLNAQEIEQKESLRKSALTDVKYRNNYKDILKKHANKLRECRRQNWPRTQAIWLRLYACDTRPGVVEKILDHIVNKGYNQINLEVFYNGQVLIPSQENNTPWPSVLRKPGQEKTDLLAETITKAHERGIKVYAWLFTMNFGYSYSQRSDRTTSIARDGKGNISLQVVTDGDQVFIDPYSTQARSDYYNMVQKILSRRPDGILFDYIRYPRQGGSQSVASGVKDLWIYSESSMNALLKRALNKKGKELIQRYLTKGYISADDIKQVDDLYPEEASPLWQGRTPSPVELQLPAEQRQTWLQWDLWQLSVAHAAQGVLDFLAIASYQAQQLKIPSGAVFFPEGNQVIGKGYDTRIQPWNNFVSVTEWHPMAYAVCGQTNSICIASQVQKVTGQIKTGISIMPAIAGIWGKSVSDRPSLEAQMQTIRLMNPGINAVSHFAYSWQYPERDRTRKSCGVDDFDNSPMPLSKQP